MKINSHDRKNWIKIDAIPENDWPSFLVEISIDIGHGKFQALNHDVSFARVKEFAAELNQFVLKRELSPTLTGTYDTIIRFRSEGRAVWVEFAVGDAYEGYSRSQAYALTGGFEIEEGALVSLVEAFQDLSGKA